MSRPVAELHADWLRLVEPDGQFLSLPVLRRTFPSGLDVVPPSVRVVLSEHYPHAQRGATPGDEQWNAWFEWLLRDVLAWGAAYRSGDDAAIFTHAVPERDIVLRADAALVDPETERPRVLVARYPHGTPLDRRLTGERWNASPLDRLALLCRAHVVRIGLLTDGERVLLAWIPAQGRGGHAIWETGLFTESRERSLLQSFISLLHASRFFAVREADQIESLFEESARAESDVTDQLGFQVRQAVELLVAALSRGDLESNGALLAGIAPQRVYEAAATVMMRLVFLLFAEERDLLPLDDPFYADSYAASTLREQLNEQAIVEGDEPLERRSAAWFRLLALFRAVYAGLDHDRICIPPYGGRLFDPDRFPFLEGRTADEGWFEAASRPLPIDDLTVRAILEALQTLPIREGGSGERRRLSFRALDVEQIGHVYEGLLDHGAVRVDDVYVGLIGKSGDEAEIALTDLEQKSREGEQPLVSFLHDFTGKSEGAIAQLIERGRAIALGRDPDARRLLNTSCDNDSALASRVSPFFHALRRDLHDLPAVFPPQSLVVKQTSQRRSTGTEYTPRDLAEEMVRYALEPLVYSPGPRDGVDPDQWRLRHSSELLNLKICDPAVGSGAFLVSACRYLADYVVEAWAAEDPVRAQNDREELTIEARRAVVDRCLYGIDRDAMAVEMTKLSLWLVTMARERPFTFLDHAIRCGDSLLGICSVDQLRYLHIDPKAGKLAHAKTHYYDVAALSKPLLERAASLRDKLESLQTLSIRDAEEKQRLNEDADEILGLLRLLADGIVATAMSTASEPPANRDRAFQGYAALVAAALQQPEAEKNDVDLLERLVSRNQQQINAGCIEGGPPRLTLHWPLAFPEVFSQSRHGFDAVIGNPPFMGGKKISGSIGIDYRTYLVQFIASGTKGNADLVSYFFLRGSALAKSIAFLAVDSIANQESRKVSLDQLASRGWQIVRAVRSRQWPGDAGVHIAQLWLSSEPIRQFPVLDGEIVQAIAPNLLPVRRISWSPVRLAENEAIAFQGVVVLGPGFVVSDRVATALLESEPRNREVLFPYLISDDVCSRANSEPSRWIINFFDWPIEQAQAYSSAFKIVEEAVQPERQQWWQYWRRRPALYRAIARLRTVIVMPLTSKVMLPVLCRTGFVFDQTLVVVASESMALFAVLSSGIHRAWALEHGNARGVTPRYTPTACFQTFPLPPTTDLLTNVGVQLNRRREPLMKQGLTAVYNRLNDQNDDDPMIGELRSAHADVDRAVCCAYGWDDIELEYRFRNTREGVRWTISEGSQDEILNRLLELNHDRHHEEIKGGLALDATNGNGRPRRAQVRAAEDAPEPLRMAIEDDGETRLEL